MTDVGRQAALEAIAAEVRVCTNCRLHETRTRAVPGEGDPETEVVFVGEGPGFNEDRGGRPFIGRAGDLLVKLLASIGWRREDVFITNVVKCRPPDNRDPQPDEIAACAPYLRRQLEVLDPAVVVTLGRFSMATVHARRADLAGARHGPAGRSGDGRSVGGRVRDVPPGRRAPDAAIERESYADIARRPDDADRVPRAPRGRRGRTGARGGACRGSAIDRAVDHRPEPIAPDAAELDADLTAETIDAAAAVPSPDDATPQLTLF